MPEPRIVAITGAGTGIGAACARLYAAEGANPALIGRRREPLEQIAGETGGLVLVGDAAFPDTWEGFVAQIRQRYGRLDVLLACAGGHGLGTATQTSPQTWKRRCAAMTAPSTVLGPACRCCWKLPVTSC